jgi:hypothetical protein
MSLKNQIFGFLFMGLLLTGITFSSCKKDETSTINPADTAVAFSLSSNWVAQAVTITSIQMKYYTEDAHIKRELDIYGKSGDNYFGMAVVCWDFQNPPMGGVKLKKYFTNPNFGNFITTPTPTTLVDGSAAIWYNTQKSYVNRSDGPNNEFIEITKCDNTGKKISGNFNILLKNSADANDMITLTGTFTNQTYSVLNK